MKNYRYLWVFALVGLIIFSQCTERSDSATIAFIGDCEVDIFEKNKKLYLDRDVSISECPAWLEGKKFLRSSIEGSLFRITSSGILTVLAPYEESGTGHLPYPERSQFRAFELKTGVYTESFNQMDKEPFQLTGKDESRLMAIYSSPVYKGQSYRFGKDVVILGFGSAKRIEPTPWNKNTGELLYNGIRLPDYWPPMDYGYSINPSDNAPLPVPYLEYPPEVIPINIGRQLLFDDFLISETDLERVFHMPVKYEHNPVLKPETELEKISYREGTVPVSGGVCWDPDDKIFKMWYSTSFVGRLAYAISKDGINWIRPNLDVVPGTNIVLPPEVEDIDSYTVIRNWNATDTEEKWTLFTMFRGAGGADIGRSMTSPDGIHWNRQTTTGIAGDRSTHFYNPFRNKWVYSLRVSRRNGVLNRSRLYHECNDFMKGASWTSGDKVDWLRTDSEDPIDHQTPLKSQLYNFDAVAYESIMLGLFEIHHGPPNEIARASGLPKITELMFAYSRDGFHWHRPDRQAHIPAERSDVWDRGYVQSVGNICTILGDKLYFYYTGFQGDETKTGEGGGMYSKGATGVAFLRRDGFASLDAKQNPGTITTRPLKFTGKYLFVNANVPNGQLRAEVRDIEGNPIFPFTIDNSIPFSGDSTIEQIDWQGASDLSSLNGQPVRIHFELTNGSLYSFWISVDETGRSDGYVAGGGPGYTGQTDIVGKGALDDFNASF